MIPSIADQASGFANEFPDLYDRLADQIISTGERFGLDASIWSYDEILEYLNDPENQDTILSIVFGRIGTLTSGVFEFILVFLLGPVGSRSTCSLISPTCSSEFWNSSRRATERSSPTSDGGSTRRSADS